MEKARNTEEEKKMGQKWVKKEYKASETRINTSVIMWSNQHLGLLKAA